MREGNKATRVSAASTLFTTLLLAALPAAGALIVNVVCSTAAARYTDNRLMRWRWILLFLVAGQINTFYLFVMPYLITARSQQAMGGMGLTLVRIIIHPAIWAVVLFFFRVVMRHVGEAAAARAQGRRRLQPPFGAPPCGCNLGKRSHAPPDTQYQEQQMRAPLRWRPQAASRT